jgi:hypothetical protein
MKRVEDYYRAEYRDEYKNYTFMFDVACPNLDVVSKVQNELKIPALAFARKESGGDIVQVEGIVLALRALQTGSIDKLLRAYKIVTGDEAVSDTSDINELAKRLLFTLPVAKVGVDEIGKINRLIEDNIKQAA